MQETLSVPNTVAAELASIGDGVVTLSGDVDSYTARHVAEDDVKRVANQYLTPNRVVLSVVPTGQTGTFNSDARADIFGVRQEDGSVRVVVDTQDDWSTRVEPRVRLARRWRRLPHGIRRRRGCWGGTACSALGGRPGRGAIRHARHRCWNWRRCAD